MKKKKMSDYPVQSPFCGILIVSMEFDPHTLQQLIQRIYQQMRCPQCGKRVPVDFASVRIVADDFLLLQLKCETCDAYIVLQASLPGADRVVATTMKDQTVNESSSLSLKESEVVLLRQGLQHCEGSFERLFKEYGPGTGAQAAGSGPVIV